MEQTIIEEELSNNLTSASRTTKTSTIDTTNLIINRVKRVRKPKQYDNDYLLYDTSTSINKTFNQVNSTNCNLINKFKVGDLVWAKLSGHPWWPCMISNGPNSNQHYRLVGGTHRQKKYVYVEFFGPTIEHAWISESSLIDYKGVNAFKIYAQSQVDQANSKSAKEKLADKFQLKVSLSKREHWEKAIQEADYSINITVSERLVLFSKKLNDLGSNYHSSTDANNNLIDSNEESQMSNGSAGSFKRKLNSETNVKNSPQRDFKQLKFDALEMISTNSILDPTEPITNEEDEDENNSLTLSKILLDVANSNNTNNNMKSELNDYFIEQLTSQPDDLLDKKKNSKEEFDENEEEDEDNDDDDATFNSDDIDEDDEEEDDEDTSDENYSDVEKINKKKQSTKPRKNTHILNTLNDTKRNDVINAFGLRERKVKKNKLSKSEHIGEAAATTGAHDENLESDLSHDSYLIYQPDQNNKQKLSNDSGTTTLTPKRTYNKSNQTKKYKTKKQANNLLNSSIESLIVNVNDETLDINSRLSNFNKNPNSTNQKAGSTAETYLIDRYKYAVRHIRQGLSVEEACNKYRISKGALLKCLSGGTAPRGKKTRLTELEENEIVEWLINNKDLKYNEAIHLVFEQVEQIFEMAKRPNPFHNGKPSMDWWYDFLSRHPQIMASKPEWLRRGKVNDQYIRDVQSGKLRCTKFRRALLSAIQYIRSLTDAAQYAAADSANQQAASAEQLFNSISNNSLNQSLNKQVKLSSKRDVNKSTRLVKKSPAKLKKTSSNSISNKKSKVEEKIQSDQFINYSDTNNKENKLEHSVEHQEINSLTSNSNNNYLDRLVASLISDYADISENEDDPISSANAIFTQNENNIFNCLNNHEKQSQLNQQQQQQQLKQALIETDLINTSSVGKTDNETNLNGSNKLIKSSSSHLLIRDDQDDEDYHLAEENGEIESKESGEDEEDDDVDDEDDDDEDGQTHITTLNEFA